MMYIIPTYIYLQCIQVQILGMFADVFIISHVYFVFVFCTYTHIHTHTHTYTHIHQDT